MNTYGMCGFCHRNMFIQYNHPIMEKWYCSSCKKVISNNLVVMGHIKDNNEICDHNLSRVYDNDNDNGYIVTFGIIAMAAILIYVIWL